jgi:hypothetical protein
MSERTIRLWRDEQARSLAGWKEPDGWLVPTESDPEERERIRERLQAQVYTLNKVLGEAGA